MERVERANDLRACVSSMPMTIVRDCPRREKECERKGGVYRRQESPKDSVSPEEAYALQRSTPSTPSGASTRHQTNSCHPCLCRSMSIEREFRHSRTNKKPEPVKLYSNCRASFRISQVVIEREYHGQFKKHSKKASPSKGLTYHAKAAPCIVIP